MKNQLLSHCVACILLLVVGAILQQFLISQDFVLMLGLGLGMTESEVARKIESKLNRRKSCQKKKVTKKKVTKKKS